jgi:hypothetical protein
MDDGPDETTLGIYVELIPNVVTLLVRDDTGDEPENG